MLKPRGEWAMTLALDAAIKASNGFASRYGDGVRAYYVSDGTTNCDLRIDDGFRFTRRGR